MKIAQSFTAASDGEILIDGREFGYRISPEIVVEHDGGPMAGAVTLKLYVEGTINIEASAG